MVYQLTSKFPNIEKFGLSSQLQRAAISISSNLAEGTARNSQKEKARFTEISYGSLMEVLSQLILSYDLGYITNQQLSDTRKIIEEIGNKLNRLRQSQLKT